MAKLFLNTICAVLLLVIGKAAALSEDMVAFNNMIAGYQSAGTCLANCTSSIDSYYLYDECEFLNNFVTCAEDCPPYVLESLQSIQDEVCRNDDDDDLDDTTERVVDILAIAALATVGAAFGVSASFKIRGKDFPADPLTLVFLMQGIAITARISQLPKSYREGFASKFEIFNMKNVNSPAWARDFMNWKELPFFNDSATGERLKDHFFYLVFIFVATVIVHRTFIALNDHFQIMKTVGFDEENRVPKPFKFPNVEISEFMALNMGMLDLGSDVIVDKSSSVGWKVLAAFELGLSLYLIFWFYKKAQSFHNRNEWRENKNIKSLKPLGSVDVNGDGLLTMDELKSQFYRAFDGTITLRPENFTQDELDEEKNKVVVTPEDAEGVFKKMLREDRYEFDADGNMSVRLDDFVHELYERELFELGAIGKAVLPEELFLEELKKVPFSQTSGMEGFVAFLPFVGQCDRKTGAYFSKQVLDSDVDDSFKDWDGYFKGFAPPQKYYYLQNMAMQVASAFILNGFSPYPFLQSIFMFILVSWDFHSIIQNAPYGEMAQSREELVSKGGRVLVYLLVFLSFEHTAGLGVDWVSGFLINTQATMISNSVSNQAAGIVVALAETPPEPLPARELPPEVKSTELTRAALQEVRRSSKPSKATVNVLEAVCQILGHRLSKSDDYHQWKEIQAIMSDRTFLQQILKYDPLQRLELDALDKRRLTADDFYRIEEKYLNVVDIIEVSRSSRAVASLHEWALTVIEIVRKHEDPNFDNQFLPQLPRQPKLSFNEHKGRPTAARRKSKTGELEMTIVHDHKEAMGRARATRRNQDLKKAAMTSKKPASPRHVSKQFAEQQRGGIGSFGNEKREMSLDRFDANNTDLEAGEQAKEGTRNGILPPGSGSSLDGFGAQI